MNMIQRFEECDTCKAKPGMPILCNGCLHNRNLIEKLQSEFHSLRERVEGMKYNLVERSKHRNACDNSRSARRKGSIEDRNWNAALDAVLRIIDEI